VRIDPRYFRLTEVDELLGDQGKAHQKLGWRRTTTFLELVAKMVRSHLCMRMSPREALAAINRVGDSG
jgi:GDPmannose 4,6-dehydratase